MLEIITELDVFSWRPSPSFHGFIYGPYSFIFVHIRSYSSIFVHIHGFIYGHIRSYSSIFVHLRYHLRPFTTIYDHGPGKPDSFQNTRSVSFENTRTPLYQILMKWIYYKGKMKNGKYHKNQDLIGKYQGDFTFSPKTWNHPTVSAVILGGAVCKKHSLEVEFWQKQFSVNVRVVWWM